MSARVSTDKMRVQSDALWVLRKTPPQTDTGEGSEKKI